MSVCLFVVKNIKKERLRHLRESGHYGVGHNGDPLTVQRTENQHRSLETWCAEQAVATQSLHRAYKKECLPKLEQENTERRAILQDCRSNLWHNASFRVKETVKEMAKTLYQILYSFRFIFPSFLSYIPLHHRKALIDDAIFYLFSLSY